MVPKYILVLLVLYNILELSRAAPLPVNVSEATSMTHSNHDCGGNNIECVKEKINSNANFTRGQTEDRIKFSRRYFMGRPESECPEGMKYLREPVARCVSNEVYEDYKNDQNDDDNYINDNN